MVNAAIGGRERSEATRGATRRWGRTSERRLPSVVEVTPLRFQPGTRSLREKKRAGLFATLGQAQTAAPPAKA